MASSTPKLDLDTLLSNYDGPILLDRLMTIFKARNSTLSLDALRLAVVQSKKGLNVDRYQSLVGTLQDAASSDPLAKMDVEWAASTRKKAKSEGDRLEAELKQYKNNLIKESIRMANEDLGNHYLSTGEWTEARKAYTRMREYCISSTHLAGMSLKLLYVAIVLGNWSDAQSNRLKMLGFAPKDDTTPSYDAVLVAAGGLIALNMGNYREAAEMFLKVNPIYMNLQPLAGVKFDKVLTPNDIAIYGGLCALATMDAEELRTNVLENQPFRQFLELESHLRRAINMFCASKFTNCLGVLDAYAGDYGLDLYLQDHFEALYGMIRAKSLVRWFSAFSVIELAEVKRAFPERKVGDKSQTVEEELERMIQDGRLHARIDLADGLLVAPETNQRVKVIEDALNMAQQQERALRLRLHRINMQAAGLEIKAPTKGMSMFETDIAGATLGRFYDDRMSSRREHLSRGGSGLV